MVNGQDLPTTTAEEKAIKKPADVFLELSRRHIPAHVLNKRTIGCDQHRGIFTHIGSKQADNPGFQLMPVTIQPQIPGKGTIEDSAVVDFYCYSGYLRSSSETNSTSHRLPSLLITSSSSKNPQEN
jgi:hypothetical protein